MWLNPTFLKGQDMTKKAESETETAATLPEPVEVKPKGVKATNFTPDDLKTRMIDAREIMSNSCNPRESADYLVSLGYGLWDKLEGSDKPAIISYAFSDKPEDRAEYCKLIEKFEPDL